MIPILLDYMVMSHLLHLIIVFGKVIISCILRDLQRISYESGLQH